MPTLIFLAILAECIRSWVDENRSAQPQRISAKEMDALLERDNLD